MKKIKVGILIAFLLVLLFGGIKLCQFVIMPDDYEALEVLLKKSENKTLNTAEEKNRNSPFQIANGILYYVGGDGFYQYDFGSKQEKKLWDGIVPDNFKIEGKKVYWSKMSERENDNGNLLDVICRDLDNLNKKEVLIREVSDYVFSKNTIVFSRFMGEIRLVYQYDITTSRCKEILSFDAFDEEGSQSVGDLMFISGDYLIFEGNVMNTVASYNMTTKTWGTCFHINFKEKELYFRIIDIQEMGDYLFIQGTVCDTTKSAIGGPYQVEDAEETGIWQVNIQSGERKKLTQTVYYGGIYILNHALYGIDNGEYVKICM